MLVVPVDCIPLSCYRGLCFNFSFYLHYNEAISLLLDFNRISALKRSHYSFILILRKMIIKRVNHLRVI